MGCRRREQRDTSFVNLRTPTVNKDTDKKAMPELEILLTDSVIFL
jgi:hypothetical protein